MNVHKQSQQDSTHRQKTEGTESQEVTNANLARGTLRVAPLCCPLLLPPSYIRDYLATLISHTLTSGLCGEESIGVQQKEEDERAQMCD